MKYIIVGLGNFGASLAEKLTSRGNEVIGIDNSMEKVDALKEKISHTICMDATDQFTVTGLPLKDTDVVIVAIGEHEGANIMVTALFKNLQVKRLISRAINPLHENVLQAIGVDEIVHPEEETAERWTKKLCLNGVVDSFELGTEYSIVEASVPTKYIGLNIGEIKMREKYNLLVLTTIKNTYIETKIGRNISVSKVQGVANPDTFLEKDDILVLFGSNEDIQEFLKKNLNKLSEKKMTKFLSFLLFFLSISIHSQVTLRIVKVPENTSVNDTIFFAGSINSWNPASLNYILKPDSNGFYTITFPESNGTVSFKFTRGSWNTVEVDSEGKQTANRTFTFSGVPQIIDLVIQNWQNALKEDKKSTASSNVQILSSNFDIPQLQKQRRIWLYLPPDYFTTNKRYPVLYMQDGQNLFDDATSYSGEWQIDETLNKLHAQGDYGAIVVGIDNGGADRINEYSPWKNPQYSGGEGEHYIDFIAQTLKPYIDKNYRTNPKASQNALIGSSLGALISTYGAVKYSNTFGKVGNLSPAYWFVLNDLNNYILSHPKKLKKLKIYFVAGQNESSTLVSDIATVKENLIKKGVKPAHTFVKIDPDGVHNESYWSKEFAALYLWLFPQK